jgi:hypothetical protein
VDFEQWVTTTLDSAAASALQERAEIPQGLAERTRPVAVSA